MDPYLESHWLDVHTKLTAYAADALNRSLPPDLIASTEERVAIESEAGEERMLGLDVRVFEPSSDEAAVAEEVHGGAIRAPFRLVAQVEPITERFIRIVEAGTERVITVIEFVSPTNKRGAGLGAFKQKRAELLGAGIHFVEVDLTRSGDWRALLRPHRPAKKATSTYRVAIRSPRDPGAVYLHPIRLQDRLPPISIPLRPADPDVELELQILIEQAYGNGRYERRLDYRKPPEPDLDADDAAWAAELLKSAGKR